MEKLKSHALTVDPTIPSVNSSEIFTLVVLFNIYSNNMLQDQLFLGFHAYRHTDRLSDSRTGRYMPMSSYVSKLTTIISLGN